MLVKLRPLAVMTLSRSLLSLLANLPTVAESGITNYFAASWYGIFAPAAISVGACTKIEYGF
jgi:tripartite-type tricarboxylate transporter receptor subunit TctC